MTFFIKKDRTAILEIKLMDRKKNLFIQLQLRHDTKKLENIRFKEDKLKLGYCYTYFQKNHFE